MTDRRFVAGSNRSPYRTDRAHRGRPIVLTNRNEPKKKVIPLPMVTGLAKIEDRPVKILVPPGIGDIHWVMLRLRGILKASGCDKHKPIIHVCSGDPAYDRSRDFVKMIPWVEWGGYFDIRPKNMQADTHAAFFDGKIFAPWKQFDMFLSVNKFIEQGWKIDDILPEAGPADWDYPIVLPEPHAAGSKPFFLVTFYRASFYGDWWKIVNPKVFLSALGEKLDDLGLPHEIIIVGAKWDQEVAKQLQDAHERVVNMVGQTSMAQLFGMKRAASGFLGHPSGSGMMAQHIGCPTVLLWGPWWQFTDGMRTNWARPEMRSSGRYRAMPIESDPHDVASAVIEAALP